MFILIGIIAAVFVVYIISKWWVDGLVSGMEFLALSVIYGGLVFGLVIVSSKKSIGPILIVLTPIIASVAWVIYNNQKFSLRQYYLEKIRDYELAIQADPRNIAARTMLAEAYYKLGELDSAIAAMELVVQMAPTALTEAQKLRQWQEERDLLDSKTILCRNCFSKNLWGATLCRTCRQPLVYSSNIVWKITDTGKKRLGYYAIGFTWAILSVLAFQIFQAQQAAIVVICLALAGIGWILLASSKSQTIR